MQFVFIAFFIIFIALALYFLSGSGVRFILGRSAFDENKKPRYQMRKLSRIFSVLSLGLSLSAFMGFLGFTITGASWLVYLAPVLFVVCLGAFLLTIINVDKYKISNRRHRFKDDE